MPATPCVSDYRNRKPTERECGSLRKSAVLPGIASQRPIESYACSNPVDLLWNSCTTELILTRRQVNYWRVHRNPLHPSHRSHIDYLLLSYVLYHNGLTPPHIAAGINLKMPVVGGLLRRAGAFFMHRSFRGDALYQAVFDEYLHQMFIKGYSVEYFIEGGRSRTGRTLHPKTGLLSMTISSFLRNSRRPVCLMPVYFGYERVLEVSTYMGELSGKHKKRESLDIIGVIRSSYSFGRVTVTLELR